MIYLLLTWLAFPVLWWRARRRRVLVPQRILVIQSAKIGDFVATTPVFRALRQRLPQAEIVALLHPVNAPLAAGLDSIDRVITLPAAGYRGWAGKRWLLAVLSAGFDSVLVLSPNLTTFLLPLWAGVPRRVSVLPDRRQGSARLAYPFLTHGEAHRRGQLFRETALRALAGLGVTVDQALLALPNEVALSPAGERKRQTLRPNRPGPLIGVGLGAGNRMKALDLAQLQVLTEVLLRQAEEATLILVGTAVDRPMAAELLASLPAGRVIDTTGQWQLAELPSLLAALDCFVGVDSGATYIADALGVPVIDFMGPADADDQRPLGKDALVIRSDVACAPCSHAFDSPYVCHTGTRDCIKAIHLDARLGKYLRAKGLGGNNS